MFYNDRTRGDAFKLKERRFRLDVREVFHWESGESGAGTGCPERLWMLHPWRCSRPGWMEPWATWSSTRSGAGDWSLMILGVPSNPSRSMILWFPVRWYQSKDLLRSSCWFSLQTLLGYTVTTVLKLGTPFSFDMTVKMPGLATCLDTSMDLETHSVPFGVEVLL